MFPKNKNQKIQENPRNYLFSSNKNEQNSGDLKQKIRTLKFQEVSRIKK